MTENRSGWAYGERGGSGEWLCILGSAYKTPELHPTEEAALVALGASGLNNIEHLNMTVAHVAEVWHGGVTGPRPYAYRITVPMSDITNQDIQQLSSEAGQAGDLEQMAACRRALAGDQAAREECARVARGRAASGLDEDRP